MSFIRCMEPLTLRSGIRLKNRLIFTAMGLDLANEKGCFTNELENFYTDIADGQVSAAILANSSVCEYSRLHPGGLLLVNDEQKNHLRKFTDPLEERECISIVQLQHYGGQGSTQLTNAPLLVPSMSPDAELLSTRSKFKIMEKDDISDVINKFARSAILAQNTGARGVQIQAGNGYLLSSFLSPFSNTREDEYGGDIQGRSRIVREIIAAIRNELHSEMAVSVRMNVSDFVEVGGLSIEDVMFCIQDFAEYGVDFIELTCCVRKSFSFILSPSVQAIETLHKLVKKITSISKIPVTFTGGTANLQQAEQIIENKISDMVAMGRALFADNQIITKSLSGKIDDIDFCLFDGNCFRDKANPLADRVYCCVSKKYPRPPEIAYKDAIQ